jgi:uncharacterized Ntn-hydrolase superfamily protein
VSASGPTLHTFSIVARCPRTGDFGIAVATARPAVGALVPWVSPHGALATQARTNTDLGRQGLALLAAGVPIATALGGLVEADPDRARRQVHGVDRTGTFTHTGAECVAWCGHLVGDAFTVAGNMLAGADVLPAMAEAFLADANAELSSRLVRALQAGQAAGGDQRGKQSAALLVASAEGRGYHNLRVDDHPDPVAELARLYDVALAHWERVGQDYGPEAQRLFGKVKL